MTTQPLDPKLVDQLADILANARGHGENDHHGQASAALAWLDQTGRLACDPVVVRHVTGFLALEWPDGQGQVARIYRDALDEIVDQLNELNGLRLLLGLNPDQRHLCGATADGPEWGSWTAAERVCLRPAGHTYPSGQPSRHRGLCGSWTA